MTAADLGTFYGSANVGWRFWESESTVLDGLVGYCYWQEKYVASGGVFVVPPAGPAFPPGPSISERFTWQGFQLGLQVIQQLCPGLAFKSRVMLIPILSYNMRDVHFLRTDLRQDPSAEDRANDGFGITADFRFTYGLWRSVYLELGYRVWDAMSGQGQTIDHFTAAPDAVLPLNKAQTFRQGLILGLSAQF